MNLLSITGPNLIVHFVFSYLATMGFGILINIPHNALLGCGAVGSVGWITFILVYHFHLGTMLSNLSAALVVGLGAAIMARVKKMPMILFNVPGMVPLVPGSQSYKAIYNFAFGRNSMALHYLVQVGMIAGAIAMGFFLAELITRMFLKVKKGIQLKIAEIKSKM